MRDRSRCRSGPFCLPSLLAGRDPDAPCVSGQNPDMRCVSGQNPDIAGVFGRQFAILRGLSVQITPEDELHVQKSPGNARVI